MDADGVYWDGPPEEDTCEWQMRHGVIDYVARPNKDEDDYTGARHLIGEVGHPCFWWPCIFLNSINEDEQQRFNVAVQAGRPCSFKDYSGSYRSLCTDAKVSMQQHDYKLFFDTMVTMRQLGRGDARMEKERARVQRRCADKKLSDVALLDVHDESDDSEDEEEEMLRAYLASMGIPVY